MIYSYGPPHIAEKKQDKQLKHTYSSSVRIRNVALKTCQRRWTIGRSGKRGSGIFLLVARSRDELIRDVLQWTPTYSREKAGQPVRTYISSSVRIRNVALKTCQRRWTIGRSGDRGSGISMLVARQDDDDDDDDGTSKRISPTQLTELMLSKIVFCSWWKIRSADDVSDRDAIELEDPDVKN